MTYTEAVSYLQKLQSAGMQMGLERMQNASKALLHPETAYPTVHITGTNGKGSTAAMIAAMLTANGYKVGLYTSPMVTEITDMIQIDGNPISKTRFAECITEVATAVPHGLSEYECLTTAVFLCFRKEQVDIAVIECCLGGETDATNILPPPLCAVFTPIALDHTAILGDSIEKIAACKSGIIKPSCDVVCSPAMSFDALGVLYEKAAVTGSTIYQPKLHHDCTIDTNGITFDYDNHRISLRMVGSHQQDNALTALETIKCLHRHGFRFDTETSIQALGNVTLPCRQEILSTTPFVMIDGSHNPHGIQALRETLNAVKLPNAALLIGMLADKDVTTCLQILAPYFEQIICCTPDHETRALPADDLAQIAKQLHEHVIAIDNPVQAYLYAKKSSDSIVVGGSFYTAATVRKFITQA